MRKKLLTLILSISMVLSMSVPSFAATASQNKCALTKGVKYCALGDSIPAGCKMFLEDEDYVKFRDGNGEWVENGNNWNFNITEKSFGVYDVARSYVTKFANLIKADDETSFNGSYPGMRAEDLCMILGVHPDEKNYNPATFAGQNAAEFLMKVEQKKRYQEAVNAADVITITLGENEFSAFFMSDSEAHPNKLGILLGAITGSISKIADKTKYEGLTAALTQIQNNLKSGKLAPEALFATVVELSALTKEYASVLGDVAKALDDTLVAAAKDFRKYWNVLMNTIHKLNPDAIVIVTSLPNPFSGPDVVDQYVSSILGGMSFGQASVDMPEGFNISIKSICQPFVTDMNLYMASVAKKYGYYIADIGSVDLTYLPGIEDVFEAFMYVWTVDSTTTDTEKNEKAKSFGYDTFDLLEAYIDGVTKDWTMIHPSDDGHTTIAQIVNKTYKTALTLKTATKVVDKVKDVKQAICRHSSTIVKKAVKPTLFTKGYSGDTYCRKCGKLLKKGEVLKRKTLW